MIISLMQGDCLDCMADIPDGSVDLTVTSPPYNIGKAYEKRSSMQEYMELITPIISECCRITRDGGSIFFQLGNHVNKGAIMPLDMVMWPLFDAHGMALRNRIVWTFGHGLHCKNRFSGRYEVILWMTKGDNYTFNLDDVRVPSKYPMKRHYKGPKAGQLSGNPLGKNPSDVWDISNVKHNHPEKTAHPCQFPEALADRCIMAASNAGDTVFDPFMGSGTVGVACKNSGRSFIGIELDKTYFNIAKNRIENGRSSQFEFRFLKQSYGLELPAR
jgi:adenine-specific DNA-methyltransferase